MKRSTSSLAKPLLRAPPFPGLTVRAPGQHPIDTPTSADRETLFEALRQTRVGGAFWSDPWRADTSRDARSPAILVRSSNPIETREALAAYDDAPSLTIAPADERTQPDPWSLLPTAKRLIAHGWDEWIALAAILNVRVHVLSPGLYGQPGDTSEDLKERAMQALTAPFPNPFGSGWLTPQRAIELLSDWRRVIDGNRGAPGERIVVACGMSWWKRDEIRRFLWSPGASLTIHRSASRALDAAARRGGSLAVWPSRISPDLEKIAASKGVKLVRVEDGFVRSVGLGSNLVPPLSVIVDRCGIHYDPSRASDLEVILAQTSFSPEMTARAARLRTAIVKARISKYAAGETQSVTPNARPQNTKRIVLVPGQVEDDMSVLSGGGGLTSNLELLRRARELEPDAEIWWRPHPDVDAGHRKGAVDDAAALEHADRIVREGPMSDLLDQIDALHTLTSLSGFEALLRGADVICHGTPFYAGWGLTRDLGEVPSRRGRTLSLDELVAGVLLLYPRYLDPVTGLPCPPETLVQRLASGRADNRLGWVEPLRRFQGAIMRRFRKGISR